MSLLPKLLQLLDIKETGQNTFTGGNLDIGSPQIYGGHVLAQAVVAAYRTVSKNKYLQSLHSYFLHPGDNQHSINYEVEMIKNGRSFDVRRVLAKQNGRVIFLLAASFHIREESVEHQALMPNVTRADKLTSFPEMFSEFADKFKIKPRGLFSAQSPILFHPVEHYNPINPGTRPARAHTWFRPNGDIPDDPVIHLALLCYASDFNLLITALLPHGMSLFTTPMRIASLDHAMWFHRPFKLDDWYLYTVISPNLSDARGYCQGRIFSQDGNLIASVTQEGLIRKID